MRRGRSRLPPPPRSDEERSLMTLEALLLQAVQEGNLEMQHFWHVFVAYAAAWVLIFGWVVSILRRLRKVEKKIES